MEFNFNGREAAETVRALYHKYDGIETPLDLYEALSDIWCAETCAPRIRHNWSPANKTCGQCSITAFLVQDIFGGEVYGIPTDNGGLHCYNVVDGASFDLTSEQFGEEAPELVYDGTLQERESAMHFFKEEKRARYEYICKELAKKCERK